MKLLSPTIAILTLLASPASGQTCASPYSAGLSSAQVEELDREGALISRADPGKPALDCPDVLERVARSHHAFLTKHSGYYIVLPNGDAINAYRALRLREIEDEMRLARGHALERLERAYNELAPGRPHLVCFEGGDKEYDESAAARAVEGDTVYEYIDLPPLFEHPVRPQADTLAAHAIFGSRMDSPEHNDFHIDQQTDHWLIGHKVIDGRCTPQRIAVHRDGARITGNRLERACVLWPLNRTAESRRDYWDRSPLPLYIALDAEARRSTPAELACAAEQGRVVLHNFTVRSDRSRSVRVDTEPSSGTGFIRKSRSHGPWVHRVFWRTTPVSLRIVDHDTHLDRRERRIEHEDTAPAETERRDSPDVTHALTLRDGRVLRGRLASDAKSDPLEFVVVVGSIEHRMTFARSEVRRVDQAE